MNRQSIFALLGFLAACAVVSALGGGVTSGSVNTWYQGLAKPPFNPPDWIFAPVWTMLYIFIAVAGWRVWRAGGFASDRTAMLLYWGQLALNLVWSFLFFGAHALGVALIEILVLLALIVLTAQRFFRHDHIAGWLFVPYIAWVSFASLLNASIWWLN